MKTALLFGATGLTGRYVYQYLLKEENYSTIRIFTRSPFLHDEPRVENIVIDFEKLSSYESYMKGDVLFCCLGTTRRKAGSRENFRKVDYDYVTRIAEIAEKAGVKKFLVISSIGADAESKNYYLRVKGEKENFLIHTTIPQVVILRPSLLLGRREEFRFGEEVGKQIYSLLKFLLIGPLRKYRGIHAKTVARAMVRLANVDTIGRQIVQSDQIAILGRVAR
ncbi:MAG TPA: NAD(P)H-binding protein [Bacteroidales bacterium]|nr:NAD(P)H-binding protein [Bacteroidales bacterium]